MLKNHIIVGNGKWAKKIILFLKKYKIAKQILIISRKKKFISHPNYKKLNKNDFTNILKHSETAHICSSNKSHLKYFNFFSKKNINFIIEKPIVNNLKELKKIKLNYKSKYLVNYIDLFNYDFGKIYGLLNKNKNKKTSITIIYSNHLHRYKKKQQLFESWLDHPLAIILFLKKKFSNFKVIKFESNRDKKGKFNQNLEVEYKFNKIKTKFIITNNSSKIRKIEIQTILKKYHFDLGRKISPQKSSFYRLYKNLNDIDNSLFRFNLNFHKKILKEKKKVLEAIN